MELLQEKDLKKLNGLADEYQTVLSYLEMPEIVSDAKLLKFYQRRKNELCKVAEDYLSYNKNIADFDALNDIFQEKQIENADFELEKQSIEQKQKDLIEKINHELFELKNLKQEKVTIEINSKDDSSNVKLILTEILSKYCEQNDFDLKVTSQGETDVFEIEGKGAYERLKNLNGLAKYVEFGKESFATIVVLKNSVEEMELNEDDFEFQTLKSSGAGGQHINKTESAIRVIHKPTGITVKCEDQRSQTQNKEKAIQLIKQKIMQNNEENLKNNIKIQRNNLKNAIFSSTPSVVIDIDKNKFDVCGLKMAIKFSEAKKGNLKI